MGRFGKPRDRERERYYLFAGMGGRRALRRKRAMMLSWGIGAGVFVSAVVAGLLYLMHNYTR